MSNQFQPAGSEAQRPSSRIQWKTCRQLVGGEGRVDESPPRDRQRHADGALTLLLHHHRRRLRARRHVCLLSTCSQAKNLEADHLEARSACRRFPSQNPPAACKHTVCACQRPASAAGAADDERFCGGSAHRAGRSSDVGMVFTGSPLLCHCRGPPQGPRPRRQEPPCRPWPSWRPPWLSVPDTPLG